MDPLPRIGQRQLPTTSFQRRTLFVHCVTAISSIAGSAVIQLLFNAALAEKSRFILFLPAVMFSAWFGGFGAGVLAFLLGGIVSLVLFIAPEFALRGLNERDTLGLFIYFVVAGFTLLLTHAQRHAEYLAVVKQNRLDVALAEGERLALQHAHLLASEQRGRAEAEQESARKMRFVAMVAHELRTPLTSIKGFVSTLLADEVTWSSEQHDHFLGIIDEEADKLSELVDQLLDVAQIQAGQLRIHMQAFALSEIISLAQRGMETAAGDHRLIIKPPQDLPLVLGDPKRLAQVFINLVGNAAKFSPANSTISIEASKHSDGVQVGIQVDVSDEGIGIPLELRANVFEVFRQLDDVSWQTTKGSGLGLAICKGIIEAHGGTIWVGEQATPGTVISFTLPVANIA